MDAAILGPILGLLTLVLLWLRQDHAAMRKDHASARETDRALADTRHEAVMAVLRSHGERLAHIEGRAEGRGQAREGSLANS